MGLYIHFRIFVDVYFFERYTNFFCGGVLDKELVFPLFSREERNGFEQD